MRIKRFFAPDMRQAIRLLRREQGPDSVILSNQKVDGGVEVIAAADYDPELMNDVLGVAGTHARRPRSDLPVAPPASAPAESRDPALAGVHSEMVALRRLLECQVSSLVWDDVARRQPRRACALRELARLGLTTELAAEVADGLDYGEGEVDAHLLGVALEQRLPLLEREITATEGIVTLVGPTGVGKTTTVAKLAARYVLEHGREPLGLITTDDFRIGAHEQLLTFGRIVGVPVHKVTGVESLRETLDELADKRLVLVDTAGMSPRDLRLATQFALLRESGIEMRVLLTLSANTQATALEDTVRCFARFQPCGCVLTKLDEALSLGPALSILIRYHLPLAYSTDGQQVPEDIQCAGSDRFALVQRAFDLMEDDDSPMDERSMAMQFGEVLADA